MPIFARILDEKYIKTFFMINPIVKTIELPDGRTITLETGKLAKQADGSVMLRMGNTMLLATVCAAKDAVPGTDFMPLQVEYKEKYSAFGRFPGGFTKREGKASDYEILTCRLVDRALRPLFPDNFHAEVYVNIVLFSADGIDMPDALAGLAASAALAVSDIPFGGPISEVRVARIDGQFVINPTFEQLEKADMDLMVAATYDNIMMVEGEMQEVSEQDLLAAMKAAHEAIKVHCKAQMELMEEVGSTVKREYCHEENDEDLRKAVREACYDKAYAIAASGNRNKHERQDAFDAIRDEFKTQYTEEELEEKGALIDRYYHDVEKEAMRRCILDEGKRLDGRKTTEIRPIWCEVGYLPGPHGSAIFTRGETQSLTSVTLGTKLDEKIVDDVLDQHRERFLLHYNFPPYSTGEAKAQRGVGRREIGHGHLAWRALKGQIPAGYPYTVRVEELEEKGALIDRYYHDVEKEAMRRCILDEGKRLDGRKTTEIRPIWCEVGYLPGPHGSAIFTRGETQSLTSVTLGTKLDEKIVDDVLDQHRERFLLHYNFPPYSTGEAKAQRGVGRREIGHGHLAWRALKGQIPAGYPYTVRVVSDIMESNGSSSMATVCAGTLALMDAGVAMKKPVSGIAMGLIKNAGEEKYAVLSDILGDEDHLGDMDFKVTGTRDGITATQMDIKVDGLSFEILEKALLQAKEGREHILNKLTECIAEPRKDLKPHAPRIETMTIPKEFIGAIIGPGGKIIQGMQEETGATITIEETDGVGRIEIAGTNKKCIDDAMRIIKGIVAVPEVGEVYVGKVRSVMPYGVFVEFLPGKDGLLHISEIDWKRLETIEEAGLKEGDEIEVKLLDIDPKTGKFKLSHKVLLPRPEKQEKK